MFLDFPDLLRAEFHDGGQDLGQGGALLAQHVLVQDVSQVFVLGGLLQEMAVTAAAAAAVLRNRQRRRRLEILGLGGVVPLPVGIAPLGLFELGFVSGLDAANFVLEFLGALLNLKITYIH